MASADRSRERSTGTTPPRSRDSSAPLRRLLDVVPYVAVVKAAGFVLLALVLLALVILL